MRINKISGLIVMFNNLKLTHILAVLSFFAVILTYIVIGLGAFTRLTNAGLGCPDWPGCYGHFTVPTNQKIIHTIDVKYPATPLILQKARAEMIHRYVAGTLGLLIVVITFLSALISMQRGFKFLMISTSMWSFGNLFPSSDFTQLVCQRANSLPRLPRMILVASEFIWKIFCLTQRDAG